MKKYLLITLCLLAAACQKNASFEKVENTETVPGGTLLVDLMLPSGPLTKVSGTDTKESAVKTLQIFVFKDISGSDFSQNVRETDKWSADGSTTLALNTYVGKKFGRW